MNSALSLFLPKYVLCAIQVDSNGTLVIGNAQLEDAAHYRCSASNHLGKASATARVRVNLPHLQEGQPSFTSDPRNADTAEGGIVEFTCVASGR